MEYIPWDSRWTPIMLIGCIVLGVFLLIVSAVQRDIAFAFLGLGGLFVGVINLLQLRSRQRRGGPG